jgi:hypothetical protein
MREAFEAFMVKHYYPNEDYLGRHENTELYFDDQTEMCWRSFRAGAKYGNPLDHREPISDGVHREKDLCRGPVGDPINPSHYKQGGIECIEAIKAALGEGFPDYLRGNVMKYLWRYKEKGGVDDLKKARWYLDRLFKEVGE